MKEVYKLSEEQVALDAPTINLNSDYKKYYSNLNSDLYGAPGFMGIIGYDSIEYFRNLKRSEFFSLAKSIQKELKFQEIAYKSKNGIPLD